MCSPNPTGLFLSAIDTGAGVGPVGPPPPHAAMARAMRTPTTGRDRSRAVLRRKAVMSAHRATPI